MENHPPQNKQAESLKKTVPPEVGLFIWYLKNVYSILNYLKIEKDLNIYIYIYISTSGPRGSAPVVGWGTK